MPRIFINPNILNRYKAEEKSLKDESPLFHSHAFQQTEDAAKKLTIKTARKLGHRIDCFIDTCHPKQRELISRCLNCGEAIYLRGINGHWKAFANELNIFSFHYNALEKKIGSRDVFWATQEDGVRLKNTSRFPPEPFIICKKLRVML